MAIFIYLFEIYFNNCVFIDVDQDGEENFATNVNHIQTANMVIAIYLMSVFVIQIGEEYFVIKV